LAAISLIVPDVKNNSDNLNAFQLIYRNGLRVGILFLIIFVLLALGTSFLSANLDENKYIPLITMLCSLGGFILSIFIRQISKPNGDMIWLEFSKIFVGGYILIVTLGLSFLLNLVISFRSIVLKKNDEPEIIEEEIVEEEIVETSSIAENSPAVDNISTTDDVKTIENIEGYFDTTEYKQ
jgi:hypothetical protein